MKNIKILFQGDSITDAGRDRRNYHNMGQGYPKYASAYIADAHSDVDFEFINFGISGNRTSELFDRLYPDAINFQPDIISILIGVNDIWHRYNTVPVKTTDAQLALNYRCILEELKRSTNAKIVMIAPYVLDDETKDYLRPDLARILPIIEGLAAEFADVYIPLNKIFDEAMKTQSAPKYYSDDGVHPNANGAEFIGKVYAEAVEPLIKELI